MARIVNGALYVDSFTPTGNPGEYTFENALFNNQTDFTGNGAYDIALGFVIYVPATDKNTFMGVVGVTNRYVFTSLEYIDTVRISGTILWDSLEEEIDLPTNSTFCLVSQTTPNLKLAIPAVDNVYPDVYSGSTLAAMLNDIINIMDKLSNGLPVAASKITTQLPVTENGQMVFNLNHMPLDKENSILTVNGLTYAYGEIHDYTINNNVLNWTNNSLVLDMTDNMVVSYTV